MIGSFRAQRLKMESAGTGVGHLHQVLFDLKTTNVKRGGCLREWRFLGTSVQCPSA